MKRFGLMAATVLMGGVSTAACQTDVRPDLPTLAGTGSGYGIEDYRGQTIRVCGRLTRREDHWAVEHVPRADQSYYHGYPAVLLVSCGSAAPQLDRNGCFTGRVAAKDGSFAPPARAVRDNLPVSRDWFVHAPCRSSR